MSSKRSFILGCFLTLILSAGVLFAAPALAQDSQLEILGEAAGFTTDADITVIIARLIRTLISFLGVIAVVLVLYGGFVWMTAGGSAERIQKAKKILTNAIIGLVLVMASFAIAQFIINSLEEATGGGVTTGTDGGGAYTDGGGSSVFYLSSVNTECSESLQNLQLQFVFSKRVDSDTVEDGILITDAAGDAVEGRFGVSGSTVTFTPDTACAEPYEDYYCFDEGSSYSISLDSTQLEATTGASLTCLTEYPCTFSFTTGSGVDVEGPTVEVDSPDEGDSLYSGEIEMLQALTTDDTGVSTVSFYVEDGDEAVYTSGTDYSSAGGLLGGDEENYFFTNDSEEWDTTGYTTNSEYSIWAVGVDCAGNSDSASSVEIVLRASSCDNEVKDTDLGETDIDCGGDPSSDYYCGACGGDECSLDSECASGHCEDGTCVNVPEIDSISPGDGAPGNLITISGSSFGDTGGTVTFLGTEGGDEVEVSAYQCNEESQWEDDQIIVQVPTNAVDGPIQVETSDGDTERTDDDTGTSIADFDVNAIERPGLCALDPDSDTTGEPVSIYGNSFGASQGSSTFYFTNYETSSYVSWADEELSVVVPNVNSGTYRTSVYTGDYVCLDVLGEETGDTCSTDDDCDTESDETCATSWCSETLSYCDDDDDCGDDGGSCESIRVGSNKVNFTVEDASSDSTPIISSVDSGWKACSDSGESCASDDDCDSGVCEDQSDWGPYGQYVTIYGTNFGSAIGSVYLENEALGYDALGDTSFPDYCSEDYWHDTSITIKVPETYLTGGAVEFDTHNLYIVRQDNIESEAVEFTVIDDSAGPSICDVDPSAGPAGTEVTIYGERFGDEDGDVTFYNEQGADVTASIWDEEEISSIPVPEDAATGPVYVITSDGYESNSFTFAVGNCNEEADLCSDGEVCCQDGTCSTSCTDEVDVEAHYAYLISTATIPNAPSVLVQCDLDADVVSPSPWTGWSDPEDVCLNSAVTATFDMAMDTDTLNASTVTVELCVLDEEEDDPDADADTTVDSCVEWEAVTPSGFPTPSSTTFTWYPPLNDALIPMFEADSWYRVTLSGGGEDGDIQAFDDDASDAIDGAYLANDFEWEFWTSASTDPCDVGDVILTPSEFTATTANEEVDYLAQLVAANDDCQILSCTGYTIVWDSDDDRAVIDDLEPAAGECTNVVRAEEETLAGYPAIIESTVSNAENDPSDTAELTIDFIDPEVEEYFPDCSTACVNALPWASFNTEMNWADTVSVSTVSLFECEDSLCEPSELIGSSLATSIDRDEALNRLEIVLASNLSANTWYRVILDADEITSTSGVPLSEAGSNYGSAANQYYQDSFSWKFKTKDSDISCGIDSLRLSPDVAEMSYVGEREEFDATAYGAPDDCDPNGQALQGGEYEWDAWTAVDDPNNYGADTVVEEEIVAYMIQSGSIKLTSELPEWCSTACLNIGAPVTSNDPVCGDTATDYGEECDDGNTSNGDGCSSECLLEGSDACSYACSDSGETCAADSDCTETCDDGVCSISGDSCATDDGSDCPYYSGSCEISDSAYCCGDGVVEAGVEECDDFGSESGDGCSASCLNEGSSSVDAVCGDNTVDQAPVAEVAGGEDCDDGNTTNGDGCSRQCLYEGGVDIDEVYAVCGDGDIDNGEDCDPGAAGLGDDTDGCSDACLNIGTTQCVWVCSGDGSSCSSDADCSSGETCGEYSAPCCGNSSIEDGEDCDGGEDGEDGCSDACLSLGSSAYYDTASYCGDGDADGTGEECDAEATSSLNVGAYGVAQVAEGAPLEVAEETGYAISVVTATADGVKGEAILQLECSCDTNASCGETDLGCGTSNCCFDRPEVTEIYPAENVSGGVGVGDGYCRNTSLYIDFTAEMDLSSFDLSEDEDGDGVISEDEFDGRVFIDLSSVDGSTVSAAEDCPTGYTALALGPSDGGGSLFVRAWSWVRDLVFGLFGSDVSASSTYTCLLPVSFESQSLSDGQRVYLRYQQLLEEEAIYRLVVLGDDDATDTVQEGALSEFNVPLCIGSVCESSATTRQFYIGDEICALDAVSVEDIGNVNAETYESLSEELFTQDEEEHEFLATPLTYRSSSSSVEEISPISGLYEWEWSWGSEYESTEDDDVVEIASADLGDDADANFTAVGNDGDEAVLATATVTVDVVSETSTEDETVTGSLDVSALLCENPWPAFEDFPFVETDERTNFSFYYCRDAGEDGTADDLPALEDPIDVTSLSSANILQELIFRVEGTSDAIGVRVIPNEGYLSPEAWVEEQSFTGSFAETTLDGYHAIESGTTIYAAAANVDDADIYPNMYIVSYNDNAEDEASAIFDEILENWSFNANEVDVTDVNLCVVNGDYYLSESGSYVSCTWDGACLETCSENVCTLSGAECALDEGCPLYVDEEPTCDAEKGMLTRDMNRLTDLTDLMTILNDYGEDNRHCSVTKGQSCHTDAECPGTETCIEGYPTVQSGTFVPAISNSVWSSWNAVLGNDLGQALPEDPVNAFYHCVEDGYDAASCWNGATGTFVCPDNSHLYAYQSAGGEAYTLYGVLESDIQAGWYYDIDTSSSDDVTLSIEYPTDHAPSTVNTGFAASPTFCDGSTWGDSTICGDGVQGSGEDCELGDTDVYDCTDSSGDPGRITVSCSSSCDWYGSESAAIAAAEASGSECVPYECGNGVVDAGEQCDDGANNGTYGYCGELCTVDSGYYCGDGYLAGGEACDCGATGLYDYSDGTASDSDDDPVSWAGIYSCAVSNGQYDDDITTSCAFDCTAPGPSCGDGELNGDEACDGDYEEHEGGLCSDGVTACDTNSDCDSGVCGGTVSTAACGSGVVCENGPNQGMACPLGTECGTGYDCSSFEYDLFRYRTCADDCSWPTWSACVGGDQVCGNGTQEGDEECDDGNDSNNDECLNTCELNVCGDDYVYSGVESCDDGTENGELCEAGYEDTCNYCNVSCQYKTRSGAYCGDGEINGGEVCDGGAVAYSCIDTSTDEVDVSGSCDATDNGTQGDCSTGYTCRWVGVCNGGNTNGDPCTLQYVDGVGVTELETDADTNGCDGGACVAPTCGANCASQCPFTYETTGLLIQSELSGASPTDSLDLYSYQNSDGDTPDNAALYIPACSVATQIAADVSNEDVELPNVDVVFVTDLSGSMNDAPGGGTTRAPNRRIDIVAESTSEAIEDLFDVFDSGGSTLKVGLVSYQNTSATTDQSLSTNESALLSMVEGYTDRALNGTPTAAGVSQGISILSSGSGDVKILILLSDGSPSYYLDGTGCSSASYAWTAEVGGGYSASGGAGCAAEVRYDSSLIGGNDHMVFYSAVISSDPNLKGYMAHESSEECNGVNMTDATECGSGAYAFAATTEEEIKEMYEAIVNSILNTTVSVTATDGSGVTHRTTGQVEVGSDTTIPFPTGFVCGSASQTIPLRNTYYGSGPMNFSNFTMTYCPYE